LVAGCCVGTEILFGLARDDSLFCVSFVCSGVALQWKDFWCKGVTASETLSQEIGGSDRNGDCSLQCGGGVGFGLCLLL
jgi:hypothetical protein